MAEDAMLVSTTSALAKELARVLTAKVHRATDTVKRITGSGRSNPEKRPEDKSLNSYALLQAYVLMAVTGLGYLALTWSTVVLLGGFVTSLGNKDFWCLTCISLVQAARIFNDSGDNLFPIFLTLMQKLARKVLANRVTVLWVQVVFVITQILSMPVLVVVIIAGIVYAFGPVACIVLSVWRLWQHDYGNTEGDDNKANLVPALIIFYCLVICQVVLYYIWWLIDRSAMWVVVSFCKECNLPKEWGSISVVDYLYDTRVKCWRDPTSIDGRKLINYAVDLVDSESQKDYLSGARMLDTFIKLEADVRSLLLPSRPKIQKLIDTLGWRSSNRELREVVARIVAYLAGDIHLSQFPGAIRCISSLLDTTLPYWNNQQGDNHHSPPRESKQDTGAARERLISFVKGIDKYIENDFRNQVDSNGDGWNELILQGLTILERLAFDPHNCSDICNTPDLLPKIMAPLYSSTLIQDINGSSVGRELQMRAIEILTEPAFDSSANLCTGIKENLIKKQLQIFLTDDEGGEEKLRVTAGKSLALLSRIKTISMFIVMEQNNILDRLNEILDAKNNITYRIVASEILENLCTHCTLDKDYLKEALLPKVLTEVLVSKRDELPCLARVTEAVKAIVATKKHEENQAVSGPSDDEENQLPSKHSGKIKSSNQTNKEFQEALLSLTLVVCVSANDFNDVAREISLQESEFVRNLKAIVEQSCKARADCLRIVKLCGQIAILMLQRSHVTADLEECVKSLCKASKIMSNLESCMLFAGTDCGVKKTARPLLSDIAKKASQLVGN
ncbi:hypothetical protein CFC21_058542 [Triticum aestivum]|uniref:Uncharacterized protein n=2 Tax=Triticum aestivum TaxID=4565 RepID=A0A3B6ISF8_WHEAT|nr:hypothetical protein CFC21_058542 [Triticum aestivum]